MLNCKFARAVQVNYATSFCRLFGGGVVTIGIFQLEKKKKRK